MNVYDFDKTIYKNDCTVDFYLFCIKKRPLLFFTLFRTLLYAFRYYILKIGSKTDFKEKMYSFLKKTDALSTVEEFWDKNISKIRQLYLEHKKVNDVVISASPEFLLKPICNRLNIRHLIASRVDPKSGKYDGINCSGEEKVKRFYEHFPHGKIDMFFSDSHSDDPLAKIAEKSFIVSKDKITPWKYN